MDSSENRKMPTTPEPTSCGELTESPRRSKLKRRMIPKAKEAPTNFFLASISAADIAIPTVEVPDLGDDVEMLDRAPMLSAPSNLLTPITPSMRFTTPPPPPPPKTPAPRTPLEDTQPHRPDWRSAFNNGSPGCETIGSDWSDQSDKSFYSGTQASNETCTSPESDTSEVIFPLYGTRELWHIQPLIDSYPGVIKSSTKPRTEAVNHGLWSSEMNKHLWATYERYLDDPTVTPYHPSSPPAGVYRRVAQEAKRTFKDACKYSTISSRKNPHWPHSTSETCNHLKGMVKRNMRPAQVPRYRESRSPSPSTLFKPRRIQKNRFVTPESEDAQKAFSTRNIAVALAASTSAAMQPDGPLARLARDQTSDILGFSQIKTGRDLVMESRQQRFGSPPFIADTYSPSSSRPETNFPEGSRTYGGPGSTDAFVFRARKQQHDANKDETNNIPRLQSPVCFDGSRSPRRRVLRPVCLTERFIALSEEHHKRSMRGPAEGEEALQGRTRSRRPVITSECFQAAPVLPPGWESSAAPTRIHRATTVSSSPFGALSRFESPCTANPNSTCPRERTSKPTPKTSIRGIMRQRPSTFDNNYFRRFNEEQAKVDSAHSSGMFHDHASDLSDSDREEEE